MSVSRVLIRGLALTLSLVLLGCTSGGATTTSAPSAAPSAAVTTAPTTAPSTAPSAAPSAASAPITLRLSHDQPIEHPNTANIQLFADEVERLSGGNVKVQIFPAAQLFSEDDVLPALQRGEVDLGLITNWETLVPAALITDLPFQFTSWEAFHSAIDGAVGTLLTDAYAEKGIHTLYFQDNTVIDLVGTRSKLVKTPDDIKGLRMRSFSEATSEAIELWGAAPTQIPGAETYTAVQRGTVDGIMSGVSFFERKWYEVTPFITQIPVSYSSSPLQINQAKWDSLSEEQRGWITEAAAAALADNREKTPTTNVDAYNQLKELAEEFYVATPEEQEAWKAATTGMGAWYVEKAGDLGQQILDALK